MTSNRRERMEEITVRTIMGYTEEERKKQKRNICRECDGMCQTCRQRCLVREEKMEI
jgi:hypothetical protein